MPASANPPTATAKKSVPAELALQTRQGRVLDPKWQNLHALLVSYHKEFAQSGQVRKELRQALFEEIALRLQELARVVVAKHNRNNITSISDAVNLKFWERQKSLTNLMQAYDPDKTALQGFNFFYKLVQNIAIDVHRSQKIDALSHLHIPHESQAEEELMQVFLEQIGDPQDFVSDLEQIQTLNLVHQRIAKLPVDLQKIAQHMLNEDDQRTQDQCATELKLSLANYKRRRSKIIKYLSGELDLQQL
jgi:hypothetical protein